MTIISPKTASIPAFWGRSQKFEASPSVRHLVSTPTPPSSRNSSSSPAPVLQSPRGYFAFPPSASAGSSTQWPPETPTQTQTQAQKNRHAIEQERIRAYQERQQLDEKIRATRLENEKAAGTIGEIEWVRSGGVLRDENGKRDMKRTESIRAELALKKAEAEIMARWEAYESKWHALTDQNQPPVDIHFADLPWPVHGTNKTLTVADVTPRAIGLFLLESLKVRGNTVTRRERIRSAMLRWHPDKNGALLGRVVQEDTDAVRTGISVVMTCLQTLLTTKE